MTKQSSADTRSSSTKGNNTVASKPPTSKVKLPKRQVQVVTCPPAFPSFASLLSNKDQPPTTIASSKRRRRDGENETVSKFPNKKKEKEQDVLDWHETAKEIRAYGATAFLGKQKRDYEKEQYFQLTGRQKKQPKTPLAIVRGIKKAAAKREAKLLQEAREAGIVLPKAVTTKESKKQSSAVRNYGPAPNIGFMKKGIFRVAQPK